MNSSAHFEKSHGGGHCSKKMFKKMPVHCYGTIMMFMSLPRNRECALVIQSNMAMRHVYGDLANKTHLTVKINRPVVPNIKDHFCCLIRQWHPLDLLDPNLAKDKFICQFSLVRIQRYFCCFLALARSDCSTPHHRHHQNLASTLFH